MSRVHLHRPTLILVGGTALAFAAYLNALPNGFAYDDVPMVEENADIHSLKGIPSLFSRAYWGPERGGAQTGLYRPVTLATYAVDWALWNGRPQGFHATNVLIHATVTALLALLLLRAVGAAGALAGTAVFAVHPVHVEAVANVVGRAELLATVAYLGALVLYLSRTRPGLDEGPGVRGLILLTGLQMTGILAKEGAITLPAALCLVDVARGDLQVPRLREYVTRRSAVSLALLLGLALALGARTLALGEAPLGERAPAFQVDASATTRLFTMMTVWPHYVRLLAAPLDPSPDYSPAAILPRTGITADGALGLALAAAILAFVGVLWRRNRWAATGPLWVAVTLLPVSNLLFPSGVVLAERTLYLPSVGLSFLVAGLSEISAPTSRARRWTWTLSVGAITALFALLTVRQNPVWKDTESVVRQILRTQPASYRGHWFHGHLLARRGEVDSAAAQYARALALWPYDERAWMEWAAQNLRWGRWDSAELAARRAVALDPGQPGPRQIFAIVLHQSGRVGEARAAALAGWAATGDPFLYRIVAVTYREEGRMVEAARAFRASLAPGSWDAWLVLAGFWAEAGDRVAALAAMDTARQLAPDRREVRDSLEATRRRLAGDR